MKPLNVIWIVNSIRYPNICLNNSPQFLRVQNVVFKVLTCLSKSTILKLLIKYHVFYELITFMFTGIVSFSRRVPITPLITSSLPQQTILPHTHDASVIYGGFYCLWCHPRWPGGHMLQITVTPCVANRIQRVRTSCHGIQSALWVIFEADVAGTKSCSVFFDLHPCSDDRSHIHPLVLLGVQSQQCVCCRSRTKDIFTKNKKRIGFHQSSCFPGITQGKVICNFTTLYLGSIPPAPRSFSSTSRKEKCGVFCIRKKYALPFPRNMEGDSGGFVPGMWDIWPTSTWNIVIRQNQWELARTMVLLEGSWRLMTNYMNASPSILRFYNRHETDFMVQYFT